MEAKEFIDYLNSKYGVGLAIDPVYAHLYTAPGIAWATALLVPGVAVAYGPSDAWGFGWGKAMLPCGATAEKENSIGPCRYKFSKSK